MSSIVFEDEQLQVIYRPGSTEYTLVTFTELGFVPGSGQYWARVVCEKRDITCIAFCAKLPNWYPAASMAAAAILVADLKLPLLIGYGTSMGGYAALKYSRLLQLKGTIACCPQISINPALIFGQPQYTKHFCPELHEGMEITAADLSGNALIVHDRFFKEDAQHIDILNKSCPGLFTEVQACFMGHHVPGALRSWGLLEALINAARTGAGVERCRALLRQQKKLEDRYKVTFAEQMVARKRYLALSAEVLNRIVSSTDGLVLMKKYIILSRVAAISGNLNRAADLAGDAANVYPDNPHLKAAYGSTLMQAGRHAEAEAAYAEATSIRPDEPAFLQGLAEARRRQVLSEGHARP